MKKILIATDGSVSGNEAVELEANFCSLVGAKYEKLPG